MRSTSASGVLKQHDGHVSQKARVRTKEASIIKRTLSYNYTCLLFVLVVGRFACQSPVAALVSSPTAPSLSSSKSKNLLYELVSGDIAWNTFVGVADRSFRLGIQLEKNGQARKATAAFHEAASLYQCFLDSRDEFQHVTCLSQDDESITTILAYACLRLGFLNYDALGDPKAAARLYKEAALLDPKPSAVCYDCLGESLESSVGGTKQILEEALEAYKKCRQLQPKNRMALFHEAVALERLGRQEEAEDRFDILRREEASYSCLVDSWGYVRWHTRKTPPEKLNLYRGTRCMLDLALQAAMPLIEQGGLVCEFGVGSGRSMRMAQEILPLGSEMHGFDSFTGLPQAWGNEPAGAYSTGGRLPDMEGNVYFHKGWFRETIVPFLEECEEDPFVAYANIDCALYSSTLDVLESLHGRVLPGTVLVFDEYICLPSWRQDEFRAWRECCKRFGWKYEYLAFSLSSKQAIVRIIEA